MDLRYFVYKHIRPDTNEVFYIGLGCYQKKWKYSRAKTIKNRNIHWTRIVAKNLGKFESIIIADAIDKNTAVNLEKELIALYGRSDLKKGTLCNLTDGGEGVNGMSEETKKKIGDANRGSNSAAFGTKQTESWKALMRARMTGINNPNYGKSLPEWHKELNRQKRTGSKQSQTTIDKRVLKLRGKKRSEEFRKRQSEKLKTCYQEGRCGLPSRKGVIRTEEQRARTREKIRQKALLKQNKNDSI